MSHASAGLRRAMMGAVGASAAPFYSLAFCGVLYFLFGLPVRSSFFIKARTETGTGM